MAPPPADPESFNPATRALCPDGACVGVLDETGVCPVCGQRGAPASPAAPRQPQPSDALDVDPLPAPSESVADAPAPDDERGGFDTERRLCPDGSCLGVLGPDGRCNVCGRTAS